MGRPSLGSAARNVLLATKGTQSEADALVAKYGSVYAGMRFGLRMALGVEPDERREAPGGALLPDGYVPPITEIPSSAIMPAVESVTYETTTKPHRHRRGTELDATYEAGAVKRRYACTVAGCDEVLS